MHIERGFRQKTVAASPNRRQNACMHASHRTGLAWHDGKHSCALPDSATQPTLDRLSSPPAQCPQHGAARRSGGRTPSRSWRPRPHPASSRRCSRVREWVVSQASKQKARADDVCHHAHAFPDIEKLTGVPLEAEHRRRLAKAHRGAHGYIARAADGRKVSQAWYASQSGQSETGPGNPS